eukprot:TRINITY_DN4445_c0_g1_i1.p1 TRINITY_DN4445_c0_g1~~TRINITY_DN4445_c0_g1_i1.p1  ORF type:complete len:1074 (+),score=331.75 TRINITY_DN4445_c0_g1_i1:171-3392(+)
MSNEKPVFKAIRNGKSKEDVAKHISRSNVNERDADGQSLLHIAVNRNSYDVVKLLISKKADINGQDDSGWTPLHCAASIGSFRICEILLQTKGIEIRLNKDGNSPLVYLVRQGGTEEIYQYLNVLQLMVDKGADVNARNRNGEAPLHSACIRGNLDSVRFLLQNNANVNMVNRLGETSLHYAVRAGKTAVVELLLDHGADPTIPSEQGTPLEVAKKKKQTETLKLLEKAHGRFTDSASSSEATTTTEPPRSGRAKKGSAAGDVAGETAARTGFLQKFVKKNKWQRLWFVLTDTELRYYHSPADKVCLGKFVLMYTAVKDLARGMKSDQDWCFEVTTLNKTFLLGARSDIGKKDWIQDINALAMKAVNRQTSTDLTTLKLWDAPSTTPSIYEQDRLKELLQGYIHKGENYFCADCRAVAPEWVACKFGTFVCIDCARVHTMFGISPIRSIDMDVWTSDQVAYLLERGNSKCNAVWEQQVSVTNRPAAAASLDDKKEWVHSKYIDAKFKRPGDEQGAKDPRISSTSHLAVSLRASQIKENYAQLLQVVLYELAVPREYVRGLRSSASMEMWKKACKEPPTAKELKGVVGGGDGGGLGSPLVLEEAEYPACGVNQSVFDLIVGHTRWLLASGGHALEKSCTEVVRLVTSLWRHQQTFADEHVSMVCRWWVPQYVECVSLLLDSSITSADRIALHECLAENGGIACCLLSGEHLSGNHIDEVMLLCAGKLASDARQASSDARARVAKVTECSDAHTVALRQKMSDVQATFDTITSEMRLSGNTSLLQFMGGGGGGAVASSNDETNTVHTYSRRMSIYDDDDDFTDNAESSLREGVRTLIDDESYAAEGRDYYTSSNNLQLPTAASVDFSDRYYATFPLRIARQSLPLSQTLRTLVSSMPTDCCSTYMGILRRGSDLSRVALVPPPYFSIKHVSLLSLGYHNELVDILLLLEHLIQFLETLRRSWPSSASAPDSNAALLDAATKRFLVRQTYVLGGYYRALSLSTMPLITPELLTLWGSMLELFGEILAHLFLSARCALPLREAAVERVVPLLLSQVQWTVNELISLQNVDYTMLGLL